MKKQERNLKEELNDKLIAAALCLEPGSEKMEKVVGEIDTINRIQKKNDLVQYIGLGVTLTGTVVVPIITLLISNSYKTRWTKMVCQWEKDETFRSSAGRAVAKNLF